MSHSSLEKKTSYQHIIIFRDYSKSIRGEGRRKGERKKELGEILIKIFYVKFLNKIYQNCTLFC